MTLEQDSMEVLAKEYRWGMTWMVCDDDGMTWWWDMDGMWWWCGETWMVCDGDGMTWMVCDGDVVRHGWYVMVMVWQGGETWMVCDGDGMIHRSYRLIHMLSQLKISSKGLSTLINITHESFRTWRCSSEVSVKWRGLVSTNNAKGVHDAVWRCSEINGWEVQTWVQSCMVCWKWEETIMHGMESDGFTAIHVWVLKVRCVQPICMVCWRWLSTNHEQDLYVSWVFFSFESPHYTHHVDMGTEHHRYVCTSEPVTWMTAARWQTRSVMGVVVNQWNQVEDMTHTHRGLVKCEKAEHSHTHTLLKARSQPSYVHLYWFLSWWVLICLQERDVSTHEHMNTWTNEHMNTWTHEHMNTWTHEHMNTWTHEHMNASTNALLLLEKDLLRWCFM